MDVLQVCMGRGEVHEEPELTLHCWAVEFCFFSFFYTHIANLRMCAYVCVCLSLLVCVGWVWFFLSQYCCIVSVAQDNGVFMIVIYYMAFLL